jgi:hypothetical protein
MANFYLFYTLVLSLLVLTEPAHSLPISFFILSLVTYTPCKKSLSHKIYKRVGAKNKPKE